MTAQTCNIFGFYILWQSFPQFEDLDENWLCIEMMWPDQFLLISWIKYRVTQAHPPWYRYSFCWCCLLPQLKVSQSGGSAGAVDIAWFSWRPEGSSTALAPHHHWSRHFLRCTGRLSLPCHCQKWLCMVTPGCDGVWTARGLAPPSSLVVIGS